jgi:hypothetical protein
LPDAFGLMMASIQSAAVTPVYDRCKRLIPIYNDNYNPSKPPLDGIDKKYSPYVYGEPLYDSRNVIIAYLPPRHTVAGASKRPRTSWVWHLGYAFIAHSKPNRPTVWACKLCTY